MNNHRWERNFSKYSHSFLIIRCHILLQVSYQVCRKHIIFVISIPTSFFLRRYHVVWKAGLEGYENTDDQSTESGLIVVYRIIIW